MASAASPAAMQAHPSPSSSDPASSAPPSPSRLQTSNGAPSDAFPDAPASSNFNDDDSDDDRLNNDDDNNITATTTTTNNNTINPEDTDDDPSAPGTNPAPASSSTAGPDALATPNPAPASSATPSSSFSGSGRASIAFTRNGPRRRQPPHYREIRSRVQSINEKFLPILGDVALAKAGQLRIEDLSTRINAVYCELALLRRFLDLDTPADDSATAATAASSSSSAAAGGSASTPQSASNGNPSSAAQPRPSLAEGQFKTLRMKMSVSDGDDYDAEHNSKRVKYDDDGPDESTRFTFQSVIDSNAPVSGSSPVPANPNLPLTDADLIIPVAATYRALPHSSRTSYETGIALLNEKRREKLWAVMQSEIYTFAVGYNNKLLRTTEDFCMLAYSQDGRMKRTLKNDLAISEALFDGVSGFRKRLYETTEPQVDENGTIIAESQLKDCGIRTYTNNLYSFKTKPANYYHYLFAAAFWRWVRDEIDSKTIVTSTAGSAAALDAPRTYAVNSIEDWWRECVGLCNGFVKSNRGKPEIKSFLKDRLLADEKKYPGN
ncbi:hypothetical protein BZA70DRAFT_309091 [Myxozyma melibiosi]|uniref:Transcription activator GCR1-like domain-containing protein n=1 Tax=Myxozyma melibiosi TaxID=54550 RepID=A0ABR1FET8_9ASCO